MLVEVRRAGELRRIVGRARRRPRPGSPPAAPGGSPRRRPSHRWRSGPRRRVGWVATQSFAGNTPARPSSPRPVLQPTTNGAPASASTSAAQRANGGEVTNRRSLPEGIQDVVSEHGVGTREGGRASPARAHRGRSGTLSGFQVWCNLAASMKRRAFLRGLGAAGGLAFAPGLGAAAPAARASGRRSPARRASIQIGSRIWMIATGARRTDDVDVDARRRSFCTARRPRRHADADGDAGRRDNPTRSTCSSTLQGWTRVRSNSTASPSASAPGRATTTWCCRASATRATASSRGAPPIPPLLTEPADIGPHVPPIVPEIPAAQRGAGTLGARRRHGATWRRPRSAFMCRRSTSASSCSPDRRRRAAAVSFQMTGERRPDARHRHRQRHRHRIGGPEQGAAVFRRQRQDPPLRTGRGPGGARGSDPGAHPRVRLRRRSGAVRTAVRAAQGADGADRAGS